MTLIPVLPSTSCSTPSRSTTRNSAIRLPLLKIGSRAACRGSSVPLRMWPAKRRGAPSGWRQRTVQLHHEHGAGALVHTGERGTQFLPQCIHQRLERAEHLRAHAVSNNLEARVRAQAADKV